MRAFYRLKWALRGIFLLCILAGWAMGILLGISPAPLGLCPMLVLAGAMSSVRAFVICAVIALAVYVLTYVFLYGITRRRRYGTAGILIILALDAASNIIFTMASWWYLAALALDIVLLALCYWLYHLAGRKAETP